MSFVGHGCNVDALPAPQQGQRRLIAPWDHANIVTGPTVTPSKITVAGGAVSSGTDCLRPHSFAGQGSIPLGVYSHEPLLYDLRNECRL